jgi:hypothetical protein
VLLETVFLCVKIIETLREFEIISEKSVVLEMRSIENYKQKLVTNLLTCVIKIW